MKIEDIADQFREYADLQRFAESQLRLINSLSRQVVELEQERNHLKTLLENNIPLIEVPDEKTLSESSDSETICKVQLNFLKKASLDRELTLEETKKVETYTKILQSFRVKKDKEKDAAKELNDADLLSLAEYDK